MTTTRLTTPWKPLLGYTSALVVGLLLFTVTFRYAFVELVAIKLTGRAPNCPWSRLVNVLSDIDRDIRLRDELLPKLTIVETDDKLGIVRVKTPHREFWVKQQGEKKDGPSLLAYLLVEHDIMSAEVTHHVQRGDVVLDVGAHVGTFADLALRRGASKIVMLEPDPVNAECLRRNFHAEMASGKVLLIPMGAWDSESTMRLNIGRGNSGENSLIIRHDGAKSVDVRVRPIDSMLADAGIRQINFIKMDIEGAERNALRGAARLLKSSKPRILIDAYHLPDDATVLPAVIRGANPAYAVDCYSCELRQYKDGMKVIPHVMVYF